MRKIFTLILLCAAGMTGVCAFAAGSFTSFTIHHYDQTKTVLSLESDATVAVADGNVVFTCSRGSVCYPVTAVSKWTYSTEAAPAESWETTGIDAPATDSIIAITWQGNSLSISGLRQTSTVALTASDGRIVKLLQASGSCEVSLDGTPSGIYILTIDNKSYKIAVN